MNAKWLRGVVFLCLFCLLISDPSYNAFFVFGKSDTVRQPHIASAAAALSLRPQAFMRRPYYGTKTILQRTTSFFDHDQPWYSYDNTFVRYDGRVWRQNGASVYGCTIRTSCYDGHNGYDMDLWFEPVLSSGAGTVIRAGWYNALNHTSSLGLWAAIDHGNGIATAYGHLSSLLVSVGDRVGAQWQIGSSGTSGSSTGPHLHMSAYYMPNWRATDPFGWRGNTRNPNIVPDYYLWVDRPGTNTAVPNLSARGKATYPGAVFVDDGSPGWTSTGAWTTSFFKTNINDDLRWTKTTSGQATATAMWRPFIPKDGFYEVGVYVTDTHATSGWVPYTIYSADPAKPGAEVRHTVRVDTAHIGIFWSSFGRVVTGPQWVGIGTYFFRKGLTGRLVISNATGERNAEISADGAQFVPVQGGYITPGGRAYIGGETDTLPPATSSPTPASTTTSVSPLPGTKPTPETDALQRVQPNSVAPKVVDKRIGGEEPVSSSARMPPLPNSYYFAEGYTGDGTDTSLSLTNVSGKRADIKVTYFYANAPPDVRTYQLTGQSRQLLSVSHEAGLGQSVSMFVQGNQDFIAQRTAYTRKEGFIAATDSVGSTRLSQQWFFAEADTTYGWNTLLAVLNPGKQAVTIAVKSLPTQPGYGVTLPSKTVDYTIPAQSRKTIVLNDDFTSQRFGMAIHATGPVAIERPEYLIAGPKRGGSAVFGATAAQSTWYFASGKTIAGFTERIILANPGNTTAVAHLRYLLADGKTQQQDVTVPGMGRVEVDVNQMLGQVTHGTVVTSSAPLITERQDFFDTQLYGGSLQGSTTVVGSPALHKHWYLSHSDTSSGHHSLLALLNPNPVAVALKIFFYRTKAEPVMKTYTIAPHAQSTIILNDEIGTNQDVGLALHADQAIAVEQTLLFTQSGSSGGYTSQAAGND